MKRPSASITPQDAGEHVQNGLQPTSTSWDTVAAVGQPAECFTWECAVCTYINQAAVDNCAMCGTKQEVETKRRKIVVDHGGEGWACGTCSFVNVSDLSTCEMCERLKPSLAEQSAVNDKQELKLMASDNAPQELAILRRKLETEFENWRRCGGLGDDGTGRLLWIGPGKVANEIRFAFDDIEFTLVTPMSERDSFHVSAQNDEWAYCVNEHLHKHKQDNTSLYAVLSRIVRYLSAEKQKQRVDDKQEVDAASESVLIDDFTTYSHNNIHLLKVAAEVKAAQELVGSKLVQVKGSCVILAIKIIDVVNPIVLAALELVQREAVFITLDFREFWSLTDTVNDLPTPRISARQSTNTDSVGVRFHIIEIVNRYVNDNWKWCKRSNQAATAQRRQYKFHSRGAAETLVKQMGSLELPIKTEACEQALLECDYDMEKASMKLMREYDARCGGMLFGSPVVFSNEHVAQLLALGFGYVEAANALTVAENDFDKAFNILTNSSTLGGYINLGSDSVPDAPSSSNQFGTTDGQKAVAFKNKGEESEKDPLLSQDYVVGHQLAGEVNSLLSTNNTNLFTGLIGYVRVRLANFNRFCMMCHKKHSCLSSRPVLCCDPLCSFRYVRLLAKCQKDKVLSHFSRITLCPFTDCETMAVLSERDATMATLFGNITIDAGDSQEIMLHLKGHHYLPNDQMLEFLERGLRDNDMKVTHVENVLKPELVAAFEEAWIRVRKLRGEELAKPKMAYHGTSEKNIDSILDNGLLVPGSGEGKCIRHATDTGYFGRGIYLSPDPKVSVGYCRGGKKLLICAVIMGKSFACTDMKYAGQECKAGYDTHTARKNSEWVIFNPDQVLPCYLVTLAWGHGCVTS